jgi:hypothetical protein
LSHPYQVALPKKLMTVALLSSSTDAESLLAVGLSLTDDTLIDTVAVSVPPLPS